MAIDSHNHSLALIFNICKNVRNKFVQIPTKLKVILVDYEYLLKCIEMEFRIT